MPCIDLNETVAEKFVALTRRFGAELASAGASWDKTLVRHVYDLHIARKQFDRTEVVSLANEIMAADVEAYGHQFPAYRDDPIGETFRAVNAIVQDQRFAGNYATFLLDMVHGEAPAFEVAMKTVLDLADKLR